MLATALALVTAYAGTFSVSDRTEVRARTTVQTSPVPAAGTTLTPTTTPATLSLDLLNQPSALLRFGDRRWDYTLGYTPSFVLPDVQIGATPQIINAANAGVAWHSREVRISLTEDASYSYQNTALLLTPGANGGVATTGGITATPTGQTTALQPLAAPSTITVGLTRTTLASSVRLTRRATLSMDVGYQVSGGVGAESRAVLPEQYGPRADAAVDYAATRSDHFVTSATAYRTDFRNGPCVPLPGVLVVPGATVDQCAPQAMDVQAAETWRRQLNRSAVLSVGVGWAEVRSRTKHSEPFVITPYPTANALFSQRFGERGRGQLDLMAELAPAVDVRTGLVSQRAQAQATLLWALSPRVALRGIGGAARSISKGDPLAFSLVRGEVEVGYRVWKEGGDGGAPGIARSEVDLSIGERSAWQSQDQFGSFFSTMGYFAVTVRAPALRF